MSTSNMSTYRQGHDPSVTYNHTLRTAEVEGAFVIPHIKPEFKILDVGCGPGTITTGFAKYVPQGSVTGIDLTDEVLGQAEAHLAQQSPKISNVKFEKGNVLDGLHFEDGEFDLVFCSQVLIHIPDPVSALREMKRVCKSKTGLICAREGDWPFRYVPYSPGLQVFHRYFYEMINGKAPSSIAQPDQPPFAPGHKGGSLVHVHARQAGFDPSRIEKGGKVTIYGTESERRQYATSMINRMEKGGHNEKYVQKLGATEEQLNEIAQAWKEWADDVDGWHAIMHCETICRN
ncbi:S-adenosyl-L-methionine-dependent methyltransferase [Periconia macrospinosa]|uniref:S-adenosyl-L-methionine-dependent methyltransferase n=1 Tax=Periconia macrospinosa TaxID=97972 RepID=A0A2V1E976_9PLEO|nr:S-adenosyl-L-methionine-dependent methyltransferase [Periconia macrospinosa]